jgi:hypothetical protein
MDEYKCNLLAYTVVFSYAFILFGQGLLFYTIYLNRILKLVPSIDGIEIIYSSILIFGFGVFLNIIPKENLTSDEDNRAVVDRNRIFAILSFIVILGAVLYSFSYAIKFASNIPTENTAKNWFERIFYKQTTNNIDKTTPIIVIISSILTSIGFISMFIINLLIHLSNE